MSLNGDRGYFDERGIVAGDVVNSEGELVGRVRGDGRIVDFSTGEDLGHCERGVPYSLDGERILGKVDYHLPDETD